MAEQIKTELKKEKKKASFLNKLIVFIILAIFGFIGFRYYQVKVLQHAKSQAEIAKFDNVDSDIFDFSGDGKNHEEVNLDDSKLSELTLTELREGGAEFIYQLLLKNQVQIADAKAEIQGLKADLAKYKSQEKSQKTIFVYVELRQRFYQGENFSESLKSFETLSALDKNLQEKFNSLKPNLAKFQGTKKLQQDFVALIPDLIATKSNDANAGLMKKIRHNLSKLVVIRKLNASTQTVDGIIKLVEDSLQNEDFIAAFDNFSLLDPSYQQVSPEFLEKLKAASEVQKIDQNILLYLRGSINN
jgi:hypothetical protein